MSQITDLILRMQPYPQKLKDICQKDSNFAKALKSINPKRFISLGAVILSYPNDVKDEVIGFVVYDYGSKPKFKQDFIVNVGSKNSEFIIYTRFKGINKSKYIRDISHFYQKYPTYPKSTHHPELEDLPVELRPRALDAIKLAERVKVLGLRKHLNKKEYKEFDSFLKMKGL